MKTHLHHIHHRKRKHSAKGKHLPYPHPDRWIGGLDKIMLIIAPVAPIFSIPQIYKIYSEQTAAGFAASTWVMYVLMKIPWIIYAVIHKDVPLIMATTLWFFSNLSILIGILLYG